MKQWMKRVGYFTLTAEVYMKQWIKQVLYFHRGGIHETMDEASTLFSQRRYT